MKKCIVTGASGLIGSSLIQELAKDWYVIGISRNESKSVSNKNIQYLPVDLSKEWSPNTLPEKVDAIIHLAQSEHFREFPEYAEKVFRVNTFSTLHLLDYARKAGVNTFILASSGGVYGHKDKSFTEDVPIIAHRDLGFYLGTKLCSEVLVENYTQYMNIIVLRFFFVYGPSQRNIMLIPRLVRSVIDGNPIILHGQDGIKINPTYISDAVSSIKESLQLNSSHKINIAGPEVLSLREIGEKIGNVVGKKPKFEINNSLEPQHLIGDITKMSQLLGAPVVKFDEGIRNYITREITDFRKIS
jgi:nucleoside-diphosphate-sugar epimerase